ncbi:hypothetical protein BUALT_Bualt16G0063200 [Buddleja alternifolia]|uniref:Uncharacterized protein n=1 Tax=Buddleja alternifolia TaxID=168488 RepID=A0AAV6WIR2_9LAMI|nr:hypothetical protein BUALT_Bualt16G0063200 [Buddleja alternifolia]
MVDLHMLVKKGKIASKALTCQSNDSVNMSFISPRDYEFSCSNSPIFPSKRKTHHHNQYQADQELKVMQKMFDILNRYDVVEASPLPGFGPSPVVRQLRVTDSPFSEMKEITEKQQQVDKDAEEFINKFYKDLKNQKKIAALESPSPYHLWAR